jgi:small-conductance mechanosensitive channel
MKLNPDRWLTAYDQWVDSLIGTNALVQTAFKAAVALVVAVLAWFVLRLVMAAVARRLSRLSFFKNNDPFFTLLRKAVYYALLLALGIYLIRLFDMALIEKMYTAIFIILFAAPFIGFLKIALQLLQDRLDLQHTKIDDIVFDLLNRFAGALIYALAFILALDKLGVNVMPFIAGAGVAGIAIGFAAKDTLSNLIAGILLIVDRPFEVGDRIELWQTPKNSATWGDVIDIGLRATKIRTTDNIIIIIPNNEIMLRDIINYTAIDSKIRVRVNIGVAYDADLKKAKKLILEVVESMQWAAKEPPPVVVVNNFGESSVDLQLRVWIENARKRIHTISYVTDHVKEVFDREGIEIPYPKRDIQIRYSGPVPDGTAPTATPK